MQLHLPHAHPPAPLASVPTRTLAAPHDLLAGVKNTDVLKLLGEMWRDLGDEGKKEFEIAADEDKQRYERELAKLRADGVDVDELIAGKAAARAGAGSAAGEFTLPIQRVKRLAKAHPKVKTVSTEATNALVAAVGMFVESLAHESAVQTQRAGRKTVRMVEMRSSILRSALRDFISPEDFPAPV